MICVPDHLLLINKNNLGNFEVFEANRRIWADKKGEMW